MKSIIFILLLFLSINSFAQKSNEYLDFIKELKKETKIDKSDKTVYNLLNSFYEEGLQSDEGEMKQETVNKIQSFYSDKNSKNKHILSMFLAYQDHISETVAIGKQPNLKFQIDLIEDLEKEAFLVYGKIPVIILIYKVETLNSRGQSKESTELINESLNNFPNSIPLKVYKYLNSNDEKIKQDLIKNHSKHWMVQQFQIK